MPTTNLGSNITRFNVGHAAEVLNADGSVLHTAAALSTHTGNHTTVADGQIVQNLRITGDTLCRHKNVSYINCEHQRRVFNQFPSDHQKPPTIRDTKMEWCRVIGNEQGGGVVLSGATLYRCEVTGFGDLFHPWGGHHKYIECYAGPPKQINGDPSQGGQRTHCDPWETAGGETTNPGHLSLLIQSCKIECFPFTSGQNQYARIGLNAPLAPSTSGGFNFETGLCKNTTFRDNHVWGDYSQMFYILAKGQDGYPRPVAIFDNVFQKFAGRATYGASALLNNDGKAEVFWGRNRDYDTGATVAAFYNSPTNVRGPIKDPGPASNWPSWYIDKPPPPPPPPPLGVAIETPTDGSTFTTGSQVFFGKGIPPETDTAGNFNFYDYYAENEAAGTVWLDHDRPGALNNGYTFTGITTDGVSAVDRTTGQTKVILGETTLKMVGRRTDGTSPEDSITVTFGEVDPPPPPPLDIAFEPSLEFEWEGVPDVDTVTGGIPDEFVKRFFRRIPTAWRTEWYWGDNRTDSPSEPAREVIRSGGIYVYKGQE
jgi:hypothetical protein